MDQKYCESCTHPDSLNHKETCQLCEDNSLYNQKNIQPCTVVFYTVGTCLLSLAVIVILNFI